MALAPFPKRADAPQMEAAEDGDAAQGWMTVAASGTLIAGGLLLLSGQRRAGLVAAVSGATLALLDQQATLRRLWGSLPGYVEQVQGLIGKAQSAVDDLAVKREQLAHAIAEGPQEV